MKATASFVVNTDEVEVDFNFLKKNPGIYMPKDDPDIRIINLDNKTFLWVNEVGEYNGFNVCTLDMPSWKYELFIKSRDIVNITFKG